MLQPQVTVTPAAEKFIRRMVRFSEHPTGGFRLTVSAGGFRSVAVPMACRFNGTALRDAVKEITIVDQRSGRVVLRGRPA